MQSATRKVKTVIAASALSVALSPACNADGLLDRVFRRKPRPPQERAASGVQPAEELCCRRPACAPERQAGRPQQTEGQAGRLHHNVLEDSSAEPSSSPIFLEEPAPSVRQTLSEIQPVSSNSAPDITVF